MPALGIARGRTSSADMISEEIKLDVRKDILALGDSLHQAVQTKTPIKTGTARRGWKLKKSTNAFEIRNDVEYIGALNEGLSRQARRGYVPRTIRSTQIK